MTAPNPSLIHKSLKKLIYRKYYQAFQISIALIRSVQANASFVSTEAQTLAEEEQNAHP